MNEFLVILRHDLHKLQIQGALPHSKALIGDMKIIDGVASRFSRNGDKKEFNNDNNLYLRDSYILKYNKNEIRNQINKKRNEISKLFQISDPIKLHSQILESKILNRFSEARQFPYSSYKYHLLLTCALYCNAKNGHSWKKLYLAENKEFDSPFQIILKVKDREWALLPAGGMSRVSPIFSTTWVRRTELSLGGVDRFLDGLLSQINSWSAALGTIEDWMEV